MELLIILGIAITCYGLITSRNTGGLLKVAGWMAAIVALIYLASIVASSHVYADFLSLVRLVARFMSGNVILDGITIFATGLALGFVGLRLTFLIQYRWFYKEYQGMDEEKDHESLVKRSARWGALYFAFFMWSIEIASWLARLPKN